MLKNEKNIQDIKDINIVILEDDKMLAYGLQGLLIKEGKKVDVYDNGKIFLDNFNQYSKETKFCLDYDLGDINGLEIAKTLYEAGYEKLYLLSGYDEDSLKNFGNIIPTYIKILPKISVDDVIEALLN